MISYKEKMNHVNTFIFDVDGVLTDGSVFLFEREYVRVLNSRDGYALQHAVKMGYRIFVITGGSSTRLEERLKGLGVTEVRLHSSDKLKVYRELQEKYGFEDREVLYMGDDIPDYEVLQTAGVSTCPMDADAEILKIADYQSPYSGGRHCVRDVIEQTLRVQGNWFKEERR